jgi:hypothetical protein
MLCLDSKDSTGDFSEVIGVSLWVNSTLKLLVEMVQQARS